MTSLYTFDGLRLDPQRRRLERIDGTPLPLAGKAFDALVFLVEHAGQLVTRDEISKVLWPRTVVDDSNLNVAISTLRRALKEARPDGRFVVTVAGRGYQFVAPVEQEPRPGMTEVGREEAFEIPAVATPVRADPLPAASRARLPSTWLVGVLAMLVIGAVVLFVARPPVNMRDAALVKAPALAVLPFRSLDPARRDESLELGMAETLIGGLRAGDLAIAPLSAVRRFADPSHDALAAGRALGARAVLEGHLQRDGERLRVTVRLLRVADGALLWSATYDEAFGDIFAVQDAIAAKVWASLAPQWLATGTPTLQRHTRNAQAYEHYLSGRYLRMQRAGAEGLHKSRAAFERAVALDPDFALAWVGLAEIESIFGVFGLAEPRSVFPRALEAIDTALRLAAQSGEAYAALGHIKMQYEHDWVGAEQAFDRAIQLAPGYSPAWQWRGLFLAYRGRFDEAIEHMRRAQSLDPGPLYSALIGMLLIYQRRPDAAIAHLQQTLQLDPDFPTAHTYLAAAHMRAGQADKALEHLDKVRGPTPGLAGYRSQALLLAGRRDEAQAELKRLLALREQRYVPAYDIATIHAALGDRAQALAWLERAFDERSTLIGWLPWEPVFDGLRADARYAAMLRRLSVQ